MSGFLLTDGLGYIFHQLLTPFQLLVKGLVKAFSPGFETRIFFFNDLMTLEDETTGISIYADDNNYLCTLDKDKLLNQLRMKRKLADIEEYMNSNGLKLKNPS